MRLRTRLIISFCILIFLPICMAAALLFALYHLESRMIRQNYGLENGFSYNLFSSSLQLMNRYTQTDYQEMISYVATNPDHLEDAQYLTDENARLLEKSSFLILRKDDNIVFNGYAGESIYGEEDWTGLLPEYGEHQNADGAGYFYDGDAQVLIKQVDFEDTKEVECTLFIITSSESVLPEIKNMLMEIGVSVVVILALTAGMMTIWIYRGTMTPMKKLQEATQKIKEGDLDFTIDYDENDEMGDLCRNFEEMRVRLKESTEDRMRTEQENRALISNIAHDLKTPITTVKGYSEGIIDGVADTPEKIDRYIRTIYNKANEMDRLLNELTIYSKIDTNRIPYNFQKLNVAAYFQDCIEEIGLDLETRGIQLTYTNYADPATLIIADPEQLMRVISNIINNAVKYMDKEDGRISIRIKDVGDFIQVEMEDNGKGINVKDLPYIFDRFYRTDSSRNSSTGGSGIGLSIVKKVVEDHGGQIWATSKEKVGTIMYFVMRKYIERP